MSEPEQTTGALAQGERMADRGDDMFRKMLFSAACYALTMLASPAGAAEVQINYTTNTSNVFSGLLTLDATATPGQYLATSLTGTRDGLSLSLLSPGTFPTSAPNNNLVLTTAPYLDFSGISFADSSGTDYNFYYGDYNNDGIVRYVECATGATCSSERDISSFSATFSGLPAAVPEPATWAMMLGGFAVVGAAMRGRRRPIISFA